MIAVNLSGTFYVCQAAARRMRESGGGVDREHRLRRRPDRALAPASGLHGGEARRDRADEEPRARPRRRRNPRQRDLSRPDPHAADRAVFRRELRSRKACGRSFRRAAPARLRDVAERRALPRERPVRSYVNGIALTVDGGWLAEKSFAAGEAAESTFLAASETADD